MDLLQNGNFNCRDGLSQIYKANIIADVAYDLYDAVRSPITAPASVHKLEPEECIKQYGTAIQAEWSNLVIVFNSLTSWASSSCESGPILPNATTLFVGISVYSSPFSKSNHPYFDRSCNYSSSVQDYDYWTIDFNRKYGSAPLSEFSSDYEHVAFRMSYCLATKAPQAC